MPCRIVSLYKLASAHVCAGVLSANSADGPTTSDTGADALAASWHTGAAGAPGRSCRGRCSRCHVLTLQHLQHHDAATFHHPIGYAPMPLFEIDQGPPSHAVTHRTFLALQSLPHLQHHDAAIMHIPSGMFIYPRLDQDHWGPSVMCIPVLSAIWLHSLIPHPTYGIIECSGASLSC